MDTDRKAFNRTLRPISKKKMEQGAKFGLKRTRLNSISKKQTQKIKDYRKTGFEYWGKACLLCGRTESETRLVIHHKDKNRNNNTPTNLIPLCDRNFGCGAHNHMGTEGLAQLNAKIDAKLKEYSNIHEQKDNK